ncbi:MAG: phosphotransferase [Trueperaceae bacterium]|nr:phosphotransferase [Trueperaceae bacterium]
MSDTDTSRLDGDAVAAEARAALAAFGIDPVSLELLGGLDSINFRVDAGERGCYVLGLHDLARHDPRAIALSLAWLDHLALDTDLVLPRPVRDLQGEHVSMVRFPPRRARPCTLVVWVEGEPPSGALQDRFLEEAGSVMARLHGSRFDPPPDFVRRRFDAVHASRCLSGIVSVYGDALDAQQSDALAHGTRAITALLDGLPRRASSFGMLHGDFHAGNYLIHGDAFRVIDFGRCGVGFHALDIAIALEVEAPQREAFLAGYARVRPLPPEFVEHEHLFTAMAHLDNLAFLATRPQERSFMLETLPRVAEAFARLPGPHGVRAP